MIQKIKNLIHKWRLERAYASVLQRTINNMDSKEEYFDMSPLEAEAISLHRNRFHKDLNAIYLQRLTRDGYIKDSGKTRE